MKLYPLAAALLLMVIGTAAAGQADSIGQRLWLQKELLPAAHFRAAFGSNSFNRADIASIINGGAVVWSFRNQAPKRARMLSRWSTGAASEIVRLGAGNLGAEYTYSQIGYYKGEGDFLRLVGGGNAQFAGQTASLGPSRFRNWGAHSLRMTYSLHLDKPARQWMLLAAIGPSWSDTSFNGNVAYGTLATGALGESIAYAGSVHIRDGRKAGWLGNPGFSGRIGIGMVSRSSGVGIAFSIENLGLAWGDYQVIKGELDTATSGINLSQGQEKFSAGSLLGNGLLPNLRQEKRLSQMHPPYMALAITVPAGSGFVNYRTELAAVPVPETLSFSAPSQLMNAELPAGPNAFGYLGISKPSFGPLLPAIGGRIRTSRMDFALSLHGIGWIFRERAMGGGGSALLTFRL